jgi:hypothetical protein
MSERVNRAKPGRGRSTHRSCDHQVTLWVPRSPISPKPAHAIVRLIGEVGERGTRMALVKLPSQGASIWHFSATAAPI